jgi:hypothetical protein
LSGGAFLPLFLVHFSMEVFMRPRIHTTCKFVPLAAVMQQLGARTRRTFLTALLTLSHFERRQVADLVTGEAL